MTDGLATEAISATIAELVAFSPRATGSPGGAATADYVEARFRAAGLETSVLETPSFAWQATGLELAVDGVAIPCAPVLHSGLAAHDWTGTASFALDAPLVDIGADRVRDHEVRGAIVLFDLSFDMSLAQLLPFARWIHDPGRQMLRREALRGRNPYITSLGRVMREATAAGALGVVGVLRDYPESRAYHNEYYRRTLFPLPGAWVTRADGARIRAGLRGDSTARLALEVSRREVTARTVLGVLPGEARETVMIQSHHDSVGPGAVEDASGTAEVIALAEHFGARRAAGERRRKTLLFASFDSHFTGYQAHQEFVRRHVEDPARPHDIVLNATIEHIGLRAVADADGGFGAIDETEPRGLFVNVNPAFALRLIRGIRRRGLRSTALLDATPLQFGADGIPTDASFTFVAGVPTVSLISGPLYLYDDADTLDRIDTTQLEPVARFFADVVDDAERRRGSTLGSLPRRRRRMG